MSSQLQHADTQIPKPQPNKGVKDLRACIHCSLVKATEQFQRDGCENCGEDVDKKHYDDFTSTNFEGLIAMLDPRNSWAARWQKISVFLAAHLCNGPRCSSWIVSQHPASWP